MTLLPLLGEGSAGGGRLWAQGRGEVLRPVSRDPLLEPAELNRYQRLPDLPGGGDYFRNRFIISGNLISEYWGSILFHDIWGFPTAWYWTYYFRLWSHYSFLLLEYEYRWNRNIPWIIRGGREITTITERDIQKMERSFSPWRYYLMDNLVMDVRLKLGSSVPNQPLEMFLLRFFYIKDGE